MVGAEIRTDVIGEEELAEIAALEQEIFSDSWSFASLKDTFHQSHSVIIGAWLGEKLAGYMILYYIAPEAEIARIAVEVSARRQGVAGKLLERTEEVCKKNGIEKLLLDVRESNAGAIAFYRKHGFEKDGIRKKFYTNPSENAILMSREVTK